MAWTSYAEAAEGQCWVEIKHGALCVCSIEAQHFPPRMYVTSYTLSICKPGLIHNMAAFGIFTRRRSRARNSLAERQSA